MHKNPKKGEKEEKENRKRGNHKMHLGNHLLYNRSNHTSEGHGTCQQDHVC